MRCKCYECENNELGYCYLIDPVELDENGECESKWISAYRKDGEQDG